MATIYDIAKRAGVSIATVSRVLQKSSKVKPETYAKVLHAMQELNYTPSAIAQRLANKEITSSTFGILIPDISNLFFIEILRGIYDTIRLQENNILLFSITPQSRATVFDRVQKENLQGLFVISFPLLPEEQDVFRQFFSPLIFLENIQPGYPSLFINNYKGGELAAEYLLSHHPSSIGLIGEKGSPFPQIERFIGFKEYIQKRHPLPLYEEYLTIDAHFPYESYTEMAREATIKLYAQYGVKHFFFYSDVLAYGGIKAQKDIPEKIIMIGYDDIPTSSAFHLTTIHQPGYELGKKGAELMLSLIKNPSPTPPPRLCLEPTLIVRD
ncbi:MAG: LacI family transcriptional regulator [Brevinematales bacterium]|nr:LacI family transcriptional regulator [Brevinematales bacterium]